MTKEATSTTIQDDRYDHFTRESVDTRPRGYPQLASYVSADIDGRIYRRYSYLRNRLLLHKQDEIAELEEQLASLDEEDAAADDDWYRLCSRRFDEEDGHDCRRRKLLKQINEVMKEYDDLLLREHQIMSIRQPSRKEHRWYFNYIWNEKPVCKEEYQFIYREDDFVMLGEQEDRWLGFAEGLVKLLPMFMIKYLLTPKEDRKKLHGAKDTIRCSNERTTRLVKMIVVTISSLLLVLPIVVLYVLTAHEAAGGVKIGVTVIFVVAFALALSGLTHASRHDLFGASAAYCAVLVVFLGNVPGS